MDVTRPVEVDKEITCRPIDRCTYNVIVRQQRKQSCEDEDVSMRKRR